MNAKHQRGLTLVELLVAVAIIAIAVLAAVVSQANSVSHLERRREITYANWVAVNQLTEIRLQATWPETGTRNGTETLADQIWFWEAEISNTQDPNLRRIDLVVTRETARDAPVINLTGFMGKPQALPIPKVPDSGGQNPPPDNPADAPNDDPPAGDKS